MQFQIYQSIKEARSAWLMPLVFFQLYMTLILYLFFFGPWPWPIDNSLQAGSFLIAAQIIIAIGYILSWKFVASKLKATPLVEKADSVARGMNFAKICFLVTLMLAIPTSLSRTGQLIPDVLGGIANAGYAYNDSLALRAYGNPYVLAEYARILLSIFLAGTLPLLVAYWSIFTLRWRIMGLVAIASSIAVYLATGTNKGLADLICLTPFFYFLSLRIFVLKKIAGRLVLVLGLFAGVIGFLAFFSAGQSQREGGVGEFGVYNGGDRIIWAESQSLDWLLAYESRVAYESATRYLTSGYYALALSFDVKHESTLGLGNSIFLASNMDRISGTDFFTQASLPAELERRVGLSRLGTWHSIFLWFGSDVGLYGSLLVVGGFAFLLGLSWGYSIFRADHWSLIMASQMLIMFLYLSANNQVFQSGEGAAAFVVTAIAMWRHSRFGARRFSSPAIRNVDTALYVRRSTTHGAPERFGR